MNEMGKLKFELGDSEFVASATSGPLLMSKTARARIGVVAGDVVEIEPERGGASVFRTVNLLPAELLQAVKGNPRGLPVKLKEMVWMNIGDFRLLCVDTPGLYVQEPVKVTITKSDEIDNSDDA